MNSVANEIRSYFGCSEWTSEEHLMHYGKGHLQGGHSGRYPWGSGDEPYQHGDYRDFLGRVDELKKKGWTETADNIKKEFGVSMNEYRYEKAICVSERRRAQYERVKALSDSGMGATEIGRKMGLSESTVRSIMNPSSVAKMNEIKETTDFLRDQVKEKKMIDVGKNVELTLGIKRDRLDASLYQLSGEGYGVYYGRIPQPTNPNQMTTQVVLADKGIPHKDIYDFSKVKTIEEYKSDDGGKTFRKFQYPASLNSDRLMIRPESEGGAKRDGVIELRPGVKDLSLSGDRYSQVRIAVDGTHYIKGMAVYGDPKDFPDGIDVIVNSNKNFDEKYPTKLDHLKKMKKDPENPFGSLIKPDGQYEYVDDDGKTKLGLINKRAAEGDWSEWKDQLPAQFLAKQSRELAKKQLDLAKADKADEYQSIMDIDNPTIRKYYLEKFASNCDAAAVNLSAAALPGQKYHVILPINSLKDTEIYAPKYEDGTKLALVRYPHGGPFETPILTVNNKNKDARRIIGTDSPDAVGITVNIAEQLSGADFDGDTVMCIPTHDAAGKVKIVSKKPLDGLKGFDPKASYQYDDKKEDDDGTVHYFRNGIEFKAMPERTKQIQMGVTTNLIMDMTLLGASDDELARAVRHSMVVIDAEKHKLDYRQSEKDNNIAELKKLYQIGVDENGDPKYGGSTTIVSKAKSPQDVTKRQGTPRINLKENADRGPEWYDPTKPEGALLYKDSVNAHYTKTTVNKKGETVVEERTQTQKSTRMAETTDPYTLVSEARHPMELLYADYAASMKDMANKARVELAHTEGTKKDPKAAKEYAEEVASLNARLNEALKNSVKERAAIRAANASLKERMEIDPSLKDNKKERQKASQQALTSARGELGTKTRKERNITLTDREWEAIQKGAISDNTLQKILNNTDPDDLRARATNRDKKTLAESTVNRIKAMSTSNYTIAEIAQRLDLSPETVSKYIKKGK